MGQRKSGLIRGSIHMKFSMTGHDKGDLLIQVIAWAGLTVFTMSYMLKIKIVDRIKEQNGCPHLKLKQSKQWLNWGAVKDIIAKIKHYLYILVKQIVYNFFKHLAMGIWC